MRILFDTGSGDALKGNSRLLDERLEKTDVIVLSHGHYDHTGGIPFVLKNAVTPKILCHSGAVTPRYSIRGSRAKYVGMANNTRTLINNTSPKYLHWIAKPTFLSAPFGLTGPIHRKMDFEHDSGPFYLDSHGVVKDTIHDELCG